ncbi:MAG: hypothetical protein ACJAUU_001145 [Rickettsiales bacterium]|jgi:hypothetical protein
METHQNLIILSKVSLAVLRVKNHKRALRVMKLFNLSPIRKINIPIKKKDSKQKESDNANLPDGIVIKYPSQV